MKISVCSKRPIITECRLDNFNYQVDPYIGCEHNCYYCYVLPEAETDWSEEILIHEDIVGQLQEELKDKTPQKIYMGYFTDPYQPCEAEHYQTRKILELLSRNGFSAGILTKSDLVLRDIDIFREMDNASISVSAVFSEDRIRSLFEGNTIDTERRIEALHQLKAEGIRTSALVCPVIPYISDAPGMVESLIPYTDTIWVYGLSILNIEDRNWLNTRKILTDNYKDLVDKIETVLFTKDHPYWKELREVLSDLKNDRQLNLNIHV